MSNWNRIRIYFLLTFTAIIFGCSSKQQLINDPKIGDIYICHDKGIYSPIMVDSVGTKLLYLFSSNYVFTDAIPTKDQILDEEFDKNFHLIYDREEIISMYSDGKIVEVYR